MYPYGSGQFYGQANQQMQPPMPGQMYTGAVQQPAPQMAPQMAPLAPIPTGMAPPTGMAAASNPTAVPEKRLSFITQQDQHNFGQLFLASLQPGEVALSGQTARLILMRSNLSSATLGDIWQIADTTRSGQLLFPEFCLAMYLCAKVLRGEPVPQDVHPTIRREVADMVDTISFATPDTRNPSSNAFDQLRQQTAQPVGYQQQQPQQMQAQATGGYLQPQITGGYAQAFQPLQSQATGGYVQPQSTGYTQPQSTGYAQPQSTGYSQPQSYVQPQSTGFVQPQSTGYLQSQATGGMSQPLQSQMTGGYQQPTQTQSVGLQPQITGGLQPQITGGLQPQTTGGYQQSYQNYQNPQLQNQMTGSLPVQQPLQSQSTGPVGLTPMPTGKPGQWGFINASTPGLDGFSSQFTPQASTSSASSLQGNATVSAAISKQEKQVYDNIFNEWDHSRQGMIDGAVAIDIFTKSGLDRGSLERIWTLCDQNDKGKLGRDEFAVAMHLIYRKLNGYEIPARLPPELIPPSSKHLQDSLDQMREHLKQPVRSSTGQVSYLKQRSFKDSKPVLKKDATVFKNDDNALGGYISAARHRTPPKDAPSSSSSKSSPSNVAQLAKEVREAKIKVDALNIRDEEDRDRDSSIDSGNLRAIDELKLKIRSVQAELDATPASGGTDGGSVDRQQLITQLEQLTDSLPQLTSSIRNVEREIANAKIELMRKKFEKANPGVSIPGTGADGTITEADRAAARRRAELRARMSAITGRSSQGNAATAFEEFEKELVEEGQNAQKQRDTNEQSLQALEESVMSTKRDLDRQLRAGVDEQADRNRRRWEEAVGVEESVKRFILELRRPSAPSTATQTPEPARATQPAQSSPAAVASPSPVNTPASSATPPAKETPSERIARIRAEARRKLNDSMAKRGIHRDSKPDIKEAPKEEPKEEPKQAAPEAPKAPSPVPVQQPVLQEPAPSQEDEEEKKIMQQLEEKRKHIQELEGKRKIADQEKERRLAALQKQYQELELQEKALSEEPKEDPKPESKVPVAVSTVKVPKAVSSVRTTASPVPAAPKTQPPLTITAPPKIETQPSAASTLASENREPVKQDYNPFAASMAAPSASTAPSAAPAAPPSAPAPPRSFANDDDDEWGVSEDESDDEQPRGAATPAQLASLLFGSMGPQRPQPTGTVSAMPVPEAPFAPEVAAPVAPEVAAPVVPEVAAPAVPEAAAPVAVPVAEVPPVPQAVPPVPVMPSLETQPAQPEFDFESEFKDAQETMAPAPVEASAPFEAPPAPPVPAFEAPPAPPAPAFEAPAVPAFEAPPVPSFEAPPAPFEAPAAPFEAPAAPFEAPPVPSFEAPAAPPPPAPPVSFEDPNAQAPGSVPPPPPPPPMAAAPAAPPMAPPAPPMVPPAPPMAPAAPPAPPMAAAPPAPPAPAGVPAAPAGVPSMANVLGDITRGKALRKVAPDQQRISSTELGRVL